MSAQDMATSYGLWRRTLAVGSWARLSRYVVHPCLLSTPANPSQTASLAQDMETSRGGLWHIRRTLALDSAHAALRQGRLVYRGLLQGGTISWDEIMLLGIYWSGYWSWTQSRRIGNAVCIISSLSSLRLRALHCRRTQTILAPFVLALTPTAPYA